MKKLTLILSVLMITGAATYAHDGGKDCCKKGSKAACCSKAHNKKECKKACKKESEKETK